MRFSGWFCLVLGLAILSAAGVLGVLAIQQATEISAYHHARACQALARGAAKGAPPKRGVPPVFERDGSRRNCGRHGHNTTAGRISRIQALALVKKPSGPYPRAPSAAHPSC